MLFLLAEILIFRTGGRMSENWGVLRRDLGRDFGKVTGIYIQ